MIKSESCFVINILLLITIMFLLDGVNCRSFLTLRPPIEDDVTPKIVTRKMITVDVKGSEKFTSIQDAIDSVPDGNQDWVLIHVKKGTYREKVRIPREKGHIFLRGSGRTKTVIVWSQSCENNYESSTFKVDADDFIAFGISFKNDAPTGIANTSHNQSVAAYVGGDKAAFYSCGFYSSHNTLLDNEGRHYYDRCYIQGAIDIIFGQARSVFHECEIFVIADQRIEIQGSVTAHTRTSANENTGFVFLKGRIYGIGHAFLGRPKGDHSRVVFAKTYLSKSIIPQGWSDWNHHGSLEHVYHAEYNCHGPGSSTAGRAPWLKKLSGQEAAPFLSTDFIDGKQWLLA
ncbi:putative pectinesterase [Helianthus annuus]|uniref:Pectinesterase n=1 Tax=Helianthus annuus TaxID=4232 RepID=A0A251TE90_HELAN|nr:probable pectinesterase 67 [Helianthus annuus]KAF5784540.1 putative pectinesterase [Helianthus annuus]KAJ0512227.1 putative pectinesterase [Helianthus annuus]KAJ0519657.1 putative pectinesterase [Helianthus annuus]